MENPTPFELNAAIRRWQHDLGVSSAFGAENLEELETHVRASVLALRAKGLSEEEAFLIAVRRIGDPGPLSREFSKVNAWTIHHPRVEPWIDAGLFGLGFWLAHWARFTAAELRWIPLPYRPAAIYPFYHDWRLLALVIPLASLIVGKSGFHRPSLIAKRQRCWWLAKSCLLAFIGLAVLDLMLRLAVAPVVIVLFPLFSFALVWLKDELLRRNLPHQPA